ncbi:protein catecholamines up [Daktulosphaira vitifoliae]|uniref:protein catecholamines up n=1 Tax=Daktulosphaira vitifoliae TaxID=58002 RepID=UPI0021AAE45D|nr:protein catecholamines up [Daktulosphaira vitifoliae]
MLSKKCLKLVACILLLVFIILSLPELCNSHSHHKDNHAKSLPTNDTVGWMWIKALSSTVAISIFPFFVLYFIPIDHKDDHQSLLKILLSFASGGLLGDAFLHLIPHSLSPLESHETHGHEHEHSCQTHSHEAVHDHSNETRVGLWILGGILMFLFVEKMVRALKGGHSHSHSHPKEKLSDDEDESSHDNHELSAQNLSVAGWLNVVADFTHNFTDGLAIGAAYLAGQNIGLVTTITVLLHEIPHEIGDYAILIKEGSTKKNAMKCQLVTALGAICGTLVSLTLGKESEAANSWVLPFTAGGFIYIATVNVIPSLLEDTNFKQSIKEIAALLVGVYLMVLVADYE